MIDPSIITRGAERAQMQQQQNFESLGELGNSLGRMVLGRRINTLQQLGTPEEKQAYANKSIYAPQLNAQIKADQAAALQAQMVQQKHASDIGKTDSEALKNTSAAGKDAQETNSRRYSLGSQVFQAIAGNGLGAGKALLNRLRASNAIVQQDFDEMNAQLLGFEGQEPAKVQQAAFLQAKAMLDPRFTFTTADNVLTNQTSIKNNELTNQTAQRGQDISSETTMRGQDISAETSRYGTDVSANTAAAKLAQDKIIAAQEHAQKSGEIKTTMTGTDGKEYAIYHDGRVEPLLIKTANGTQQLTPKSKMAETPEQKMARVDNVINAADASKSAARASIDAAALINHPGIKWGTGATSSLGKVPGFAEKDFQARLENLKSQVFLPTVKALQGMGALSNAEGEKIAAAVANLDPSIGEDALKKQLTILAQQMSLAAKSANKKTQNYASRGGTIPTQSKQPQQAAQPQIDPEIAAGFSDLNFQ